MNDLEEILEKFSDSKFAASFADLMMGAMGTMIVLLAFLTVVVVKGQGEFSSSQQSQMPPGLRDYKSMPITRLRVYTCGYSGEAPPVSVQLPSGEYGRNSIHSSAKIGDCFYENVVLTKGLGNGQTYLTLAENAESALKIHVHLMVGGYSLPQKTLNVIGKKGETVVAIELLNKDVIREV